MAAAKKATKTKKNLKAAKKNSGKSKTAKLTWLPKKTFELEFSIPWPIIKKTYQLVLEKAAQETEIKGFRKGKAPLNLVEKSLDKQKVYQEVLNQLLPGSWEKAIKDNHLRPIMVPKIQPVKAEENKDWVFKGTACERPEIKLGKYEQLVKGELSKAKIWTPGKEKPAGADLKKDAQQSYDQKIKIVTKVLTEKIKVDIPDLLIEDEVNRMLSRLLDQVNGLGMTIDQYLSSRGNNKEQLRAGFQRQAEATLKLEFILQAIVLDKKIKTEKAEVDKMIQATPDKKAQKKLDTPMQRAYISAILAKRKALDYLTSL